MSVIWTRDEIILACDLTRTNNWNGLDENDRRVVDLSLVLNESPLHPMELRDAKFRNPAGVARKTWDIATQHPEYTGKKTKGNKLDAIVLNEFLSTPVKMQTVAAAIRTEIRRGDIAIANVGDLDEDIEASEGRLLLARHLKRERNRGLRNRKVASAKRVGRPVSCEVCSFDFGETYGQRGLDYIEVHHVLPLHASGPTTTRLSDLVLLCANCHRMVHRGSPWLTTKDLKSLIAANAIAGEL